MCRAKTPAHQLLWEFCCLLLQIHIHVGIRVPKIIGIENENRAIFVPGPTVYVACIPCECSL